MSLNDTDSSRNWQLAPSGKLPSEYFQCAVSLFFMSMFMSPPALLPNFQPQDVRLGNVVAGAICLILLRRMELILYYPKWTPVICRLLDQFDLLAFPRVKHARSRMNARQRFPRAIAHSRMR